ncbi:MAG: hypothetical protein VX494_14740 [Actinomycetota bacterium]|nr:hypothetical protein [Actinomycetota bacterium]
MTDRDRDTWHTRDLHVLRAVADHDPHMDNWSATMCAEMVLDPDDLVAALQALEEARYIEVWWSRTFGGDDPLGARLRERGRRAVGVWPSAEAIDGLVEALRQAEEATEDPDERTLIRRAAGALGSVSRDVMTDVIAAVVARQSGLG